MTTLVGTQLFVLSEAAGLSWEPIQMQVRGA
jgi:hypothetical protein